VIARCNRCPARFIDDLGLVYHLQAAHPHARLEMLNEIETRKERIMSVQADVGPRPWQAAIIIASLMLACTAIAGLASL
jgi:hypothetical protein